MIVMMVVVGFSALSSGSQSFNLVLGPDALFIEAEDYDYGGGKYLPSNSRTKNLFNDKGLYNGLGAISNIDYHADGDIANGQEYRTGETKIGITPINDPYPSGEVIRPGFGRGKGLDYRIGWNDGGDWFNYTRVFTSGLYEVYGRFSSGKRDIHAHLDLVADIVASSSSLTLLGRFDSGDTDDWNNFVFVPLRNTDGQISRVALNGEQTIRFTVDPGNLDINYIVLVPVAEPRISVIKIDGQEFLEWNDGVLQMAINENGPWVDVPNAHSPHKLTATMGTSKLFHRVIIRSR